MTDYLLLIVGAGTLPAHNDHRIITVIHGIKENPPKSEFTECAKERREKERDSLNSAFSCVLCGLFLILILYPFSIRVY